MRGSVEDRLRAFGYADTRTYHYELEGWPFRNVGVLKVYRWPSSAAPDFKFSESVLLRERIFVWR